MDQIKGHCVWNAERILRPLSEARREQGIFSQQLATLTQTDLLDAQMQALAREVTGTLALEGEEASYESIHSFVTRRLHGELHCDYRPSAPGVEAAAHRARGGRSPIDDSEDCARAGR